VSAGEARPPRIGATAAITLRLAARSEEPAIEKLGELSGRERTSGRHLVADVDGEPWAALPVSGGDPLSDLFRPALELIALLSRRAAQLDASDAAWRNEQGAEIVALPGQGQPAELKRGECELLSPEGRTC
jgi:hypothetical protein